MLFSSISFLYYFLPIVLLLYFLAPRKYKNSVLLIASLFFYFYGGPSYFILMIISIVMGYLHGLWIHKSKGSPYRKIPLISSIIVSIGTLVFFKYIDFFIENANWIFHTKLSPLKILLPIGISFYTFQILSYTIDVYLGNAKVQKNILNFATYVALFPQLIAGPIVRYTTVEEELTNRTHSIGDVAYGINRFVLGLSKKVLIANTLGELVNIISKANTETVVFYWISAVAFMLQIYFDFSGYSDMAIGLGRIFGFHFLENFNYPYISKTITEFWRRWHMSLGTWFRDYVYIQMGGNRVSILKWVRNICVVWFLTGFWHGAQWNFIVWGLFFALFLLLEKFILKGVLDKLPAIIGHIYLLFMINISFVIFNGNSLTDGIHNLKGMFGLLDLSFSSPETIYYLQSFGLVLIIAAIGTTPFPMKLVNKIREYKVGEGIMNIVEPVFHVTLLLLITGYLIDGSFNPFLYFRF